jgi:DNA-binding transcriptional regulator YdaS (Cro superfamily)
MMTKEEFQQICDEVGGAEVAARLLRVTVRTVDYWRSGGRKIRPLVEDRIRDMHQKNKEGQ